MAITIKEKIVKIGDRYIGSVSLAYLPILDGPLKPYINNDLFEVTESNPGEIEKTLREETLKGIELKQVVHPLPFDIHKESVRIAKSFLFTEEVYQNQKKLAIASIIESLKNSFDGNNYNRFNH